MAFKHYVATIPAGGGPINLWNAINGAGATLDPASDPPFQAMTFQALKAGAADIFLGGDNTVSASLHAVRIDATDTQPPIVLTTGMGGAPLKLSDFWIFGTAADKLLVGGVAE